MKWVGMDCFCFHKREELDERIITPGQKDPSYPTNEVKNSKFNAFTFLPLNLFEQFRRPLNRYFLLIGCLQFIPIIAPVSPISTLLPLALAFLLTAIKEGYDDWQRHKADNIANSAVYHVWQNGTGCNIPCKDIAVGDMVKVYGNQEFPCDLFLISSSDPEGIAYIETANLDGELDLKSRSCVAEIIAQVGRTSGEKPPHVGFTLQAEPPSPALYTFNGSIVMNYEEIAVSSQQLLLQACYLRNTEWVWGLAVYTGHQTKVNMNKRGPSTKWAKVDQATTKYSVCLFVIQLLLALCCGLLGTYLILEGQQPWYLSEPDLDRNIWWHFMIIPLRFFLLTSVMIPISFKVIIDISKYWISLCIAWDVNMYDPVSDTPAGVKDTAIAEDLGQIEIIMSDKTGTLTENVMEFKCCTIGGVIYGGIPCAPGTASPVPGTASPCVDIDLQMKLEECDPAVISFFRILALCHSVFPKEVDGEVVFHGSSPDEEALVTAAKHLGICLKRRTKDVIEVDVLGTRERYEILETLDFTSERRRMGIVLRNLDTDIIELVLKGADDKVTERLVSYNRFHPSYESPDANGPLEKDLHNLSLFATNGLRTLCVACKEISEEVFHPWRIEYLKAKVARGDRREREMAKACDLLETDLHFVGASAIEDKLQDRVPETIRVLRQAGIALWMLTGDKSETAKQVAISCNLLAETEECLVVVGMSCPEVMACLKDIEFKYHGYADRGQFRSVENAYGSSTLLRTSPIDFREAAPLVGRQSWASRASGIASPGSDEELSQSWMADSARESVDSLVYEPQRQGYVLMISGDTLELAIREECRDSFLRLALLANSVICCRVTPPVKAALTRMVKGLGKMTLSVGDGGNDVAMLQEAHVGVGIAGKEGLQAARAADFSVAQFKCLLPLLLVHGHYSYERACYIVQYCFYKSMLLSFIQLAYNAAAQFSGVSYWDAFQLAAFNGLFTLAPVFFYVVDRSVPRQYLELQPRVYRFSQGNGSLNAGTFLGFLLRGQVQAIAVLGLTVLICGAGRVNGDGHPTDLVNDSFMTYSAIMMVQVVVVVVESHTVTALNQVAIWGTAIVYWLTMLAYCSYPGFKMYHVMQRLLGDPMLYLLQILLLVVLAVPMVAFKTWSRNYSPNELQLHRNLARQFTAENCRYSPPSVRSMSIREGSDESIPSTLYR